MLRKIAIPILISIFVVCSCCAAGEQNVPKSKSNIWAFKGKALPWTLIIASGINYTIGVEYGFNKTNSIGLDFVYNDYSFAHEVYDSTQQEYKSAPRAFHVDRGYFLNYRRYLKLNNSFLYKPIAKLINNDFLPYVSAFGRYGKADVHYQKDYITNQYSYDEWHFSTGILIGFVSGNIDFNFGPFYKQKYVQDIVLHYGQVVRNSTSTNLGFRIGMNLYFIQPKHNDHYLSAYRYQN